MRRLSIMAGALGAMLLFGSFAFAQQPAAPAAAPVPPPVGPSVTIEQAKKIVAAAMAKAKTRPYRLDFAVVDPSGSLVYFEKMDGAQFASTDIAIGKARTSAAFERPTKVFFDLMESGHPFAATLAPYIIASTGGLPLVVDGKLIGGVGVSGSPNPMLDQDAAQAGIDALK